MTTTAQTKKMEVAKTIVAQLGNLALSMMGAKDLVGSENSLQFTIRGSKVVNKIRIVLDPSDTYTMEFYKGRGLDVKLVASASDIYVDSLHKTIEANTGLYTRL